MLTVILLTCFTAAPSYTTKCDIWSVGVITYVLLCGFPPFNAANERMTYNLVTDGELKFPSPAWDDASDEAKQFIRRLMERDPERRPTATEALEDPWLNQEEIQPKGVDKRASFMPPSQACAVSMKKQVKYQDKEKQRVFQKFMKRFNKVRAIEKESSPLRLFCS